MRRPRRPRAYRVAWNPSPPGHRFLLQGLCSQGMLLEKGGHSRTSQGRRQRFVTRFCATNLVERQRTFMAATVSEYLSALPPERAAELKRVRAAIRRALPKGYEEAVSG